MGAEEKTRVEDVWKEFLGTRDESCFKLLMRHYYSIIKRTSTLILLKIPDSEKVEFEDFFSTALLGLEDAISTFGPEKGLKFETYCSHRIHNYIYNKYQHIGRSRDKFSYSGPLLNVFENNLNKEKKDFLGPEQENDENFTTTCPVCRGKHWCDCMNTGRILLRKWRRRNSLELLINPGNATAEELSELFVEISNLYKMMGGSGIKFTVTDVREPVVQYV